MQCAERGGERGEQETQRKGGRGKETDRERQRMRKSVYNVKGRIYEYMVYKHVKFIRYI